MPKKTNQHMPVNSQPKPKPATNRILNHHPRLPQYPRSVGRGDVDITTGVNIPIPSGNPISPRSNSIATDKPRVSSGSIASRPNKYRRDGSSD